MVGDATGNGPVKSVRPGELSVAPVAIPGADSQGERGRDPRPRSIVAENRRRAKALAVATIVVVVAIVLGAYVLDLRPHSPGASDSVVLEPIGVYAAIPGEQFDAVAFIAHSLSVVNGTVDDTDGSVIAYTMTPEEVVNFSREGVVQGYVWTSGVVGNHTALSLNVSVQEGSWDLVFANPAQGGRFGGNATILWFVTGVELIDS